MEGKTLTHQSSVGPGNGAKPPFRWPRPFPRPGKSITVTFGELVDRDELLEPFRARWKELKERVKSKRAIPSSNLSAEEPLGELINDELKYGVEAEQLRLEVTLAMRNEVLKIRGSRGLPDEDPKRSLAETWTREGRLRSTQQGEMKDRSVVKDM